MARNVGNLDRFGRVVAAGVLGCAAVLAPLSLTVRLAALAAPALYMLGSALAGTCLGYSLMGMNTCPTRRSQP